MHRDALKTHLKMFEKHTLSFFKEDPWTSDLISDDRDTLSRYKAFVENNESCFDSSHQFPHEQDPALYGHCTASALVVDRDLSKVVLTLHKKLKIWLQVGGHADNENQLEQVALREAYEETGLKKLSFFDKFLAPDGKTPMPFNIDIHSFPAMNGRPQHSHFDMGFVIVADDHDLLISEESIDLKWFTIKEAKDISTERSIFRQLSKLEALRKNFA